MNKSKAQRKVERKRKLINRKRRIQYRLRDINWKPQDEPMFTAGNIHYELADRVRGLGPGGVRLSVGLEDWHDIIADLEGALEQV